MIAVPNRRRNQHPLSLADTQFSSSSFTIPTTASNCGMNLPVLAGITVLA